jgi:hypothetical protein
MSHGIRQDIRAKLWALSLEAAGSLAVMTAIAVPAMIGGLGLAVDFIMHNKIKTELQAAADAAAVAGAREFRVSQTDDSQIVSAAESYAAYALTGNSEAAHAALQAANYTVKAEVVDESTAVRVDIEEAWTPIFAHFFKAGLTPAKASATARFIGSSNVCVIGLSPKIVGGIRLWNSAQLTANGCGVYSNTAEPDGFAVMDSGVLKSTLNCVAGGYSIASARSVDPTPLTDCPPLEDPLKDRPPPAIGGCDYKRLSINSGTRRLAPGVFCGGLTISGTAKVSLANGVYVIKDGPLLVTNTATLTADNAGFFLTGLFSTVLFTSGTTINLSAPEAGPLAGLLFFEDRATIGVRIHRLGSNNARKMIGTIYMPTSILNIDANAPMADQSAYTAIITQSLQLQSGPNLILNSDYSATRVPVPEGIAGTAQVVLSR